MPYTYNNQGALESQRRMETVRRDLQQNQNLNKIIVTDTGIRTGTPPRTIVPVSQEISFKQDPLVAGPRVVRRSIGQYSAKKVHIVSTNEKQPTEVEEFETVNQYG